jgi:hypothetical protein
LRFITRDIVITSGLYIGSADATALCIVENGFGSCLNNLLETVLTCWESLLVLLLSLLSHLLHSSKGKRGCLLDIESSRKLHVTDSHSPPCLLRFTNSLLDIRLFIPSLESILTIGTNYTSQHHITAKPLITLSQPPR